MAASLHPHWLNFAIPAFVLALASYAAWHFRFQRERLFRGNDCDKSALDAVRETALRDVNAHCGRYSFGIERLARIMVREQQVAVAYGQVWWQDARAHSM